MGYYPFGKKYFSDLLHYVRSGDFVEALVRESSDVTEYAFALGALAHYAADNDGHPLAVNRAVPANPVTDPTGGLVSWSSGGTVGFKGSRKSTPFAAQLAAEAAARKAMEHGMRRVEVFVKGPGSGRETAIRALQAAGLEVASIADCTPVPHNGCRPRKRPRN